MLDPRNKNTLLLFYEKSLTEAFTYLKSRYEIEDSLQKNGDYRHISELNSNSAIWRVITRGKARRFTLYVAIPHTFPDRLPKFYLTEKDYLEFGPLPHVDSNRFVCTRDEAVIVVNDQKPGEAIEYLMQVAVDILEAGLSGQSQPGFEEEFLAYWNDGAQSSAILTCAIPRTSYSLFSYKLSASLFGTSYLLAPSKSAAIMWLNRIGSDVKLLAGRKVLCIDLPNVAPAMPRTNGDIFSLLNSNLDPVSLKAFKYFRGNLVLARIRRGDEYMIILWKHPCLPIKGFRLRIRSTPLGLLASRSKAEDIARFRVKRFDRDRVARRAVDMGIIANEDFVLAIVGCGSVGSMVAMLLAKSGCSKFVLIDPEVLEEENAARHLCGCNMAARTLKKTEAVKQALQGHLPFVTCETCEADVLQLFATEPEVFDNVRLVIFATGNMAAERRANDIFCLERPKAVVYLWLEPLGVAGHMLYVSPRRAGCYRCCFDANADFRFAVAEKGQAYGCREAGCQSTFTPYGAADLEMFCAVACKEIVRIVSAPPKTNILVTWIGDKDQFQSVGYRISDAYAAHESYGVHRREIRPEASCEVCRKRT